MLEHGGNLHAAAKQFGIPVEAWLDLSTGINPEAYPIPIVPQNLWQRLPIADDGMIIAAQRYYGAQHVLPVAGSQAAIQALPALRQPCRVALCRTSYKEHAHNWLKHGYQVSYFDHMPTEDLLANTDVLVICNPNNPTGKLIPPTTLLAWHALLSQHRGWLVVDEAFMDVTPQFSLAGYAHLPNLLVLRSLGKFFGLAGARVGFVLAEESMLSKLEDVLGPWPIAGPARYIATAALSDTAWQEHMRNKLLVDSKRMLTLLGRHNLQPSAHTALFQWVPTNQAEAWHAHLAQHGIWVRQFNQWPALRFGLPTEPGWGKLEIALSTYTPSKV